MRPPGIALFWLLLPCSAWGQEHWSFRALTRPPRPAVADASWPRNALDEFVLARLEAAGRRPNRPAGRAELARRVALTLTGVLPELDELDRYLQARQERPEAADAQWVERWLASPRYGERMATHWLDLARYADTHGYHMDAHREMWRWRDWVIDAWNRNTSYDTFTIHQMAGDLLPGASQAQRMATGFHRHHMINYEDGSIAEEFRHEYVSDRVDTTGTVWLGLTVSCARCHDHQYDPLSQRDYYRLYAFFNQLEERGIDGDQGNAVPWINAPTAIQADRMRALRQAQAKLAEALDECGRAAEPRRLAWEASLGAEPQVRAEPPADALLHVSFERDEGEGEARGGLQGEPIWTPGKHGSALLFDGRTHWKLPEAVPSSELAVSVWVFATTADELTVLSQPRASRRGTGWELLVRDRQLVWRSSKGGAKGFEAATETRLPLRTWQHVAVVCETPERPDAIRFYLNGEAQPAGDAVAWEPQGGGEPEEGGLTIGRGASGHPFRGMLDELRLFGRVLTENEVRLLAGEDRLRAVLAVPAAKRSRQQRDWLRQYYLEHHDAEYARLRAEQSRLRRRQAELEREVATVMVMRDGPPRPTFVLEAGRYDRPLERVEAGTPAVMPGLGPGEPRNRLGLARWLVDRNHPLTARVLVNRIWQMHFGRGLVETPDDFGLRGARPTHPDLLDWLACELMDGGWDVKQLHRLILNSATYRQSSRVDSAARAFDPANRRLGRGPRFRMTAEMIRDQALFTSGLLCAPIGGPSVFPYQPPGLWKQVSFDPEFTAQVYIEGSGEDLYRRSLYTFWKRSVPPPAMEILDAPSRERCTVQRTRSNTPQQALVLMNERGLVEAACHFAKQLMRKPATSDRARMRRAFRQVTWRTPNADETEALLKLLAAQRDYFAARPDAARRLLATGASVPETDDRVELAAWATVCNVLFCLDEVVTLH